MAGEERHDPGPAAAPGTGDHEHGREPAAVITAMKGAGRWSW